MPTSHDVIEWEQTSGGNYIATDYPHVIVVKIMKGWYVFNRADQINMRSYPFDVSAIRAANIFIRGAYEYSASTEIRKRS